MSNPLTRDRDAFTARHRESRTDLNGRDWGVGETGTGPVLLLLPGTLGRGDVFWQQIEALKDRLRLIWVSYPATGGIKDWAADVRVLMQRRGVTKASVLGSSLGGYLAQFVAAKGGVERLIAANTLCSVKGLDRRMPYALDLDAVPIGDLRAGFAQGLSAWAAGHPEHGDLVALLMDEVNGRIPEPELRARLRVLKYAPEPPVQTLKSAQIVTVESDDDPLIPPEMRAAVRAHLTPSVTYRFAEAGHFPYVVRPGEYTALIEQAMGLAGTGPDWGNGETRAR